MRKCGLHAWERESRLPYSVFFIFKVNFFKSFASLVTMPYVGIRAFHLTKGFCIHKSIQN